MGVKLVRRVVKSNVDEPITLNNGYIVVHRRVDSDEVLGVYMVTSFRGSLKSGDKTNKEYCSILYNKRLESCCSIASCTSSFKLSYCI